MNERIEIVIRLTNDKRQHVWYVLPPPEKEEPPIHPMMYRAPARIAKAVPRRTIEYCIMFPVENLRFHLPEIQELGDRIKKYVERSELI